MIPHHVYYQLVMLVLLWLWLMLPHLWPSPPGVAHKIPTQSIKSKRKRSREPKPFAGLTQKPHCALCEAVYLPTADKYRRLTRRLSQGQKGLEERALMASQQPSEP
jgi:hypothetical protein